MAIVARLQLQDVVHYHGEKTLEEIVQAIDECDVGIIPNRRNIFTEINTPTRIFEYLSRGKPVIAPAARGIQDYFSSDGLILFELGDSRDLAQKLRCTCSRSRAKSVRSSRAASKSIAITVGGRNDRSLST